MTRARIVAMMLNIAYLSACPSHAWADPTVPDRHHAMLFEFKLYIGRKAVVLR